MSYDRVKELKESIEKAFHEPLNASQLWALVKLSKHVRLRARNNSAFNNLFNSLFPYARFRQIQKTKANGEKYEGLSITVAGQTHEGESDD